MRLPTTARPWSWRPRRRYGRQARSEHRVIPSGHGVQPSYSRKMRRMLTRLFR